MAIVHDVMPPFQLFQPASIDDALSLLDTRGDNAWVLAGGMDSFDWLKDRAKRTERRRRAESGRPTSMAFGNLAAASRSAQ